MEPGIATGTVNSPETIPTGPSSATLAFLPFAFVHDPDVIHRVLLPPVVSFLEHGNVCESPSSTRGSKTDGSFSSRDTRSYRFVCLLPRDIRINIRVALRGTKTRGGNVTRRGNRASRPVFVEPRVCVLLTTVPQFSLSRQDIQLRREAFKNTSRRSLRLCVAFLSRSRGLFALF